MKTNVDLKKENLEPTSQDFSTATILKNSTKLSIYLFQCFEDLMSENSPTFFSMMDTAEVKTTTFGIFVRDNYHQKQLLADAESSLKCWNFSCVPESFMNFTSQP